MENGAEGTDDSDNNVGVYLGTEERENLVACATNILKEENDDEVLESIVDILQHVKGNSGMREGLKSFQKNGWAFIRRTQRKELDSDIEHLDATTSSAMTQELEQANPKRNLESRLDHETHPMNNDLILKKIFEYFSVNNLKNCRLVSKKWRDLSLGSWRRKAVLHAAKLFEEPIIGAEFGLDPAVAGFTSFIKTAPKAFETPFACYDMNFDGIGMDLAPEFKIKQKKSMLDFFSSSVKLVSIRCDDLGMMCLLLTKLPELRVLLLELDIQDLYREYKSKISEGRECPLRDLQLALTKLLELEMIITNCSTTIDRDVNFPWKKIFESVAALKTFTLSCRGTNSNTLALTDEIMESVMAVREEGNLSTLNLEEITVFPTCSAAGRIVECNFPLQALSIGLMKDNNGNPDPSWILGILKAHAESLQYLNLWIFSRSHPTSLQFQLPPYFPSKLKLPNLKILLLKNGCDWGFHFLSSLDLPVLDKLRFLSKASVEEEEERHVVRHILESDILMRSCCLPSLTNFIFDLSMSFGLTELQTLAKSMPNLKGLRITLGERTFPIVYQLWPQLLALHLVANGKSYSLCDDYAITGLPIEAIGDEPCLESRGPNITNLKKLIRFVLETKPGDVRNIPRPRRACISDVSAVYGFLELPYLKFLRLETLCEFSPSVMLALKDHVSDFNISEPSIFNAAVDEASS